ncbi:MAG: hypothetical protein UR26_C0001G0233 [candidate division TM6 bacterium GW2011_GWF2_32_72]|nr:MAG: hypothetical protein UR26_C0001G0233 [candidate division TM6 bacterium GW2011_GWF2_32_72]
MQRKKKKLSVVYIITKLELGGAQKVCLSLFEQLNETDNAYLISGSEGTLVKKIKNSPKAILLKNLKNEAKISGLKNELQNFLNLIKTLRKLKRKHPTLIAHTHSTKAGIVGRWAAFFAGIKNRVHTVHGFAFHSHQNKIKTLIIWFAEFVTSFITTHFICVSSADIKTGSKLFPFFKKRSSIIRAAVEWDKFYKPATTLKNFENPKCFTFGTVSCFKPQKNLIDLLKAFELVHQQNSNTQLELIGDGILRPELETWITQHNLQHVIKLHGWQDDVSKIMINWNTFVLSSLWEGLPCAVVEARLMKLPVISYKTGGIHDVIEHNQNGYLFEQKQWVELAKAMLQLSQDNVLKNKMQNYKEDLSSFHDVNMLKQHKNLYEKL